MIEALVLLCFVVPLWLLAQEIRTSKPERLVLSPFWYFTFLYLIAFPLRAWLIRNDIISMQALTGQMGSVAFPPLQLGMALMFSALLWVFVYAGRRHILSKEFTCSPPVAVPPHDTASFSHLSVGLLIVVLATIIGIILIGERPLSDFDSTAYQERRKGLGAQWLLPELIAYGALSYIGWLIAHRDTRIRVLKYVTLAVVLGITFWASNALFTRRLIAAVALAIIVLATMRERKLWPIALLSILGTVLASGVLYFLLQLYFLLDGKHGLTSVSDLATNVFIARPIMMISSSFEGVDHVAILLQKATWTQLLSGIDQGLSWLFNAGLGLVPRVIWSSKPVLYGGMEQFHWMYPQLFRGEFATAAIPMSFAVDFSFAFGLPFALVMSYVFGRLLGAVERSFWDRASHPALVALCLFIFIYMFNWVRGGTIIVQSVILFSLPAALMFGLRPVVHAALGLAGEAVGLVGGTWWGTTRVYFYPHKYLRDRQLDTVRNWPTGNAVNAEIAMERPGAQVDRDQAIAPSRPSWKTALPLVNLKRRPKDAPDDAAVYVWGGLVAKGPFITDIDNPYAFTGYNTLAVRLYRPVIRAFLESPRCLQIRCLSQACLDGVRREYGEYAAAKALVVYPVITPTIDSPPPQLAQRCRFLFVSTQFEIKGGEALLKAFARVVKTFPGAELDLVTHLPEQFTTLANETPNVRVHSANFTRDQIAMRFLNNADVLVHPTYFDSFGMIVLEALAHGLPIIATDVYAIGEMVEHNKNGLLLEAPISIWSGRSPTALFSNTTKMRAAARSINNQAFEATLADAMIKFACDAELRTRAGRASLELVRTRFAGKA